MIDITEKLCTGCTMCGQICPTGAIEFKIQNGFRLPVVNIEKCIDCHLCEKKCPAVGCAVEKNSYPIVYSAWSKNTAQRRKCTSGGVCYELSKCFIEQGGYVCGVAWCDNYKNAEYIIVNSLDKLDLITQSKYFQPEMNDIFVKIKELLDRHEKVMFVGTSCSNAALLSFLGKKYQELLCVDFICRGYTSQLYHAKRVVELERKYNSEIDFIQYKEKSIGWTKFGTRFNFKNGESYYINKDDDPYEYMLQIDDYVTRESCFECQYRTSERVTDVTLGDFWGINGVTNEDRINGVSVVLLSSEKGISFFNSIKESLVVEKRDIWEIKKGNHCLNGQLPYKEGRERFYKDLESDSIREIHKKYGNVRMFKMKKRKEKLLKIIELLMKIDKISFVYYNFLCKKVTRDNRRYIFPYKGSRIVMDEGAKLIVHANVFFNDFKHKKSNEETYIHIYSGGVMEINGRVRVAANSSIDILKGALLKVGKTDTNYGAVIVCSNRIELGDGVDMGRNVVIYDSNFHPTKFNEKIKGRPLIIGNHVWLCTGVSIVKGLTIGDGAICGINSTIVRDVKARSSVLGNPAKCVMENVEW
ncbi:Coenzyme F420 hydrogenase/dehydrogenase, beta subunit C-terminal domain [Pseudobutyrivibrio sp. MD2005]|uniref:Coenzyme F420 hydrogenase/dehydrogenase, beta subunit C-terminal domain n=1 Tax=Pseudobutyrivibrio sp. MD2005 TaxID=1410616 RepID=UPI0004846037|nr:Coenzyme F420 hydrogenase/dehydrogenase, beta subunit C-terminal domain [Pseudobutyrivibrio sp. MD2005]